MAKGLCAWCRRERRLLVHHVSWLHGHDDAINRVSICYQCHSREHNSPPGRRPRSEYVAEPSAYPPLPLTILQEEYEKAFPRW